MSLYCFCFFYFSLGSGRSTLSMDRHLESDRHPLAITAAEAVATNGTNPWNWRDTPTNGTMIQFHVFFWYSNSYLLIFL